MGPSNTSSGATHSVLVLVRWGCRTSSPLKKPRFGDDFVIQGFVASLGGSDAGQIRLENGKVFAKLMAELANHPEVKRLLSDEYFSVDGTLIEAWASHKSFRPKHGSGDGETDPDGRLYRKAQRKEASLCSMGRLTMERRNRLAVDGGSRLRGERPSGARQRTCSRPKQRKRPSHHCRRDKAYDTADHVAKLRALNVTPEVAQDDSDNPNARQSAIDQRTTRHDGHGMSQSCHAMAECIFGWGKQHRTIRKTKHRRPAASPATSCST
jgi:hypothetical protein